MDKEQHPSILVGQSTDKKSVQANRPRRRGNCGLPPPDVDENCRSVNFALRWPVWPQKEFGKMSLRVAFPCMDTDGSLAHCAISRNCLLRLWDSSLLLPIDCCVFVIYSS